MKNIPSVIYLNLGLADVDDVDDFDKLDKVTLSKEKINSSDFQYIRLDSSKIIDFRISVLMSDLISCLVDVDGRVVLCSKLENATIKEITSDDDLTRVFRFIY